ncbi:MAG: arylsulfatase A-like enzyme, partial [Gammaproteobacteria bacterium]
MNILFITVDQWRGECLSALDHAVVKTPNLDALAKDGVLFKQHFAQATPCAPSRTSIHTGMYLHNHRCVSNGTPVDNGLNNWALEMRKLGYDPSLFGYTDTGVDPRGLDVKDTRLTHYSEPLPGIGSYTQYKGDVSMDWAHALVSKGYTVPEKPWDLYGETAEGQDWKDGGDTPLPLKIKTEDHETQFMVDKCVEWINGQTQPWVTHLSLLRPHPPFVAPEPYNRIYDPATLDHPVRSASADEESEQHPFLKYCIEETIYSAPESEREIQQAKANYYGLMSEVDDNLGRLIEQLKHNGCWESTLIILTSDHGEQMGDHWLSSKLGYFDQSYHIPLIIRDPRASADASRGKQIDAFTENVDIMPTMLDWLGSDIPSQCDGRSLMPILNNGQAPESWRKEVHWEYDFRSVLDDSVERYLGLTAHQCALSVIRDK